MNTVTYAGTTYRVLTTDENGNPTVVTPVATPPVSWFSPGTRVQYKGRVGTVRDEYNGYCGTHSGYDCGCNPGVRIDWDDTTKRASSIQTRNLIRL